MDYDVEWIKCHICKNWFHKQCFFVEQLPSLELLTLVQPQYLRDFAYWMEDHEIYCRFSFFRHSQPYVMYCISSKLLNVAERLLHEQITFSYISLYPFRVFKISVGQKGKSFPSNFITTFRSVKNCNFPACNQLPFYVRTIKKAYNKIVFVQIFHLTVPSNRFIWDSLIGIKTKLKKIDWYKKTC